MDTIIENCKKMLLARKYTNIERDETEDEIFLIAKDTSKRKVMVKFLSGIRLNISTVKRCIADFASAEITHGIILHEGEPTASAKKTLSNLDSSGKVKVSLFPMDNFKFCLIEHRLVKIHQKVKKDEAIKIKEKYGGDRLPVILSSDPIARYYNFRSGDIISVVRKGGSIVYRIVK